MADEYGAAVNTWIIIVRRARLHATTKLVALMLASYADPDGTSIYPGAARLTIQTGLSYRTIQREIAHLRSVGLIEQLPRKGLRRGWSAPYRLILHDDLLEKVFVPTPAAEDIAVEAVAEHERSRMRRHRAKHRKIRHSDGVRSDDDTPPGALTIRHGQSADQEKVSATLHVPPPKPNPPSDETDVRSNGAGISGPTTKSADRRNGTCNWDDRQLSENDRKRLALDDLEAWIRQHPESVTA